jgi:hypothetical protein
VRGEEAARARPQSTVEDAMSAHIRASAAAGEAVAGHSQIKPGALAALAGLALLLAGCADPPRAPAVGPDPADPGARAPRVDYRPTVSGYSSQRPVEPAPWGEQNESVAPAPKSGR